MSSRWYQNTAIQAALLTGGLGLIPFVVNLVFRTTLSPSTPYGSVAILPFVSASPDSEVRYLSEGIREGLTKRLSRLVGLRTTPSTMVSQFTSHEMDPHKIAAELGVEALVIGTILLEQHTIELRVHLIDAQTKSMIGPPYFYKGSFTDILPLEGQLAVRIARQCGIKLSGKELEELQKPDTDSAEAYDSYLEGRYHWNRRTPKTLRIALGKFTTVRL